MLRGKHASVEFKLIYCRRVSVGVYVCRSVTVTVAICMQGHRLRIHDEIAQIGLVFPAVGTQNLTLATYYFLGYCSRPMYFVVRELLILAYFWATNAE